MPAKKKTWTPAPVVQRVPFKPSYPPSAEQSAIFQEMKFGDEHIHIEASPGSGKSTTLKWAMALQYDKMIKSGEKINAAMLAFSKAIVTEIEPGCAPHVEVRTAHSFGYAAISKRFGRLFLQNNKVQKILQTEFPNLNPDNFTGPKKGEAFAFLFDFVKLVDMIRANLADELNPSDVLKICMQYNLIFDDMNLVMSVLPVVFRKMIENPNVIDYTDMIYLPIKLDLPIPRFDMLYVDERQDLNSLIIEYVFRMTDGRIMTCGDSDQCQPKGTLVMMSNGESRPIEDIKEGDKVVSYHSSMGFVSPNSNVSETSCRPYFGDLIDVSAGGKKSRCTPNHKWYVKWDNNSQNKHCVYLMLKNGNFRIGYAKLFYKSKSAHHNGPMMRSQAEGAEAFWILKITNDIKDAAVLENYYSYKFQIPQMVFVDNNTAKSSMDQSCIDRFWEMFGCNYREGIALLDHLNLDINYPFKTKADNSHCGFTNSFFVHACNLIDGIMMVPVFNSYKANTRSIKNQWHTIKLSTSHYHGMVYSLNVDKSHTYVSDGLLTGNSIMSFAGADIHSTERLVAKFPGSCLPLNVCYRCGTDIVKYAQTIYPKILPFHGNDTGLVDRPEELDWEMKDGSMVLSRRNANLIKPCFAFLRRGRKAIIKGKDIGAGLMKLIDGLKAKDITDLIDKIEIHKDKRIEKLTNEKDVKQSMIERVQDECACVTEIALGCKNIDEVKGRIDMIFDEKTQGITLSSIHRSKGLEANQVTIIDYNRVRLCNERMTPEDHCQEKNLEFVGVTRAKKILHLID